MTAAELERQPIAAELYGTQHLRYEPTLSPYRTSDLTCLHLTASPIMQCDLKVIAGLAASAAALDGVCEQQHHHHRLTSSTQAGGRQFRIIMQHNNNNLQAGNKAK